MALILNTAPATEPVTRAEAALFMRYTGSLQNDVIDSLIAAARKKVEIWTGRTLVTTTWDFYPDEMYYQSGTLCDVIEIPTGDIIAVSSITYQDTDDATQTLSSSLYGVDNKSVINSIFRKNNQNYPSILQEPNAVKITFTAGYGAAAAVPEEAKTAIKMMVAGMYENRESFSIDDFKDNPAVKDLMNTFTKYRS